MSIEGQHSYRFGYLKSEQWSTVRLEALAREDAKCQICGERSLANDAHHKWYPDNIYETTVDHLVILCRPCHDFIHTLMPDCKTGDEQTGRDTWSKFSNAIITWRRDKAFLFHEREYEKMGVDLKIPCRTLREELIRIKNSRPARPLPPPQEEWKFVIATMTKWFKSSQKSEIKWVTNDSETEDQ